MADATAPLNIRHIAVAGRDDHPSAANGVHGVARQMVCEQRAAGHDASLILLTSGPAVQADSEAERTVPIAGQSIRGRTIRLYRSMAAELGVADVVTIDGPRFGADRDKVLADCDYFVMASRYEGLPLAALEAAAAGLPLLMTEETGLAGAVRQYGAGIRIEVLSAEAVQAALGQASLQSPAQWARQRTAAHQMAMALADWTMIASQLCTLYGGIAESPPPSRSVLLPYNRGPALPAASR